MLRQIGQVLHHGAVDEAGAAGPGVLGQRLREDRHVLELRRVLAGPFARSASMYRSSAAAAPVQRHRARRAFLCIACSMIALIGAKPVPEASSTIGLSESSRRKKLPNGPSKRRMSFSFIVAEHVVGELAAGQVADVQLDAARRACGALAIE